MKSAPLSSATVSVCTSGWSRTDNLDIGREVDYNCLYQHKHTDNHEARIFMRMTQHWCRSPNLITSTKWTRLKTLLVNRTWCLRLGRKPVWFWSLALFTNAEHKRGKMNHRGGMFHFGCISVHFFFFFFYAAPAVTVASAVTACPAWFHSVWLSGNSVT